MQKTSKVTELTVHNVRIIVLKLQLCDYVISVQT